MGGSTRQTTNSTQTRDPYAPAAAGLQDILTRTGGLLDSGVGSQAYTGQRYGGLGDQTKAGLDATAAGAAAGAPTAAAGNSFVGGVVGNGGATAGTSAAAANFGNIDPNVSLAGLRFATSSLDRAAGVAGGVGMGLASGAYDTDADPLEGMAGRFASGPTQTQQSLQATANGAYLNGSPQLDAITSRAENDAASQVAQHFAASGRYGSGRFAAATADAVANAGNQLRYTDFQNAQDRQASAASAIDSARNAQAGAGASVFGAAAGINSQNAGTMATGAGLVQTGLNAGLAGQQALYGAGADNVSRALGQGGALMSAAQGDRAASMAGIAALPTVQDSLLQGGKTLAGVGGIQDAARQDQINANMSLFDDQANAPWRQLSNYAGLIQPIAGLGGTANSTEVKTLPQASLWQQLLGTALVGSNIASKFYNPTSAASSALSSNLFGGGGWGGG